MANAFVSGHRTVEDLAIDDLGSPDGLVRALYRSGGFTAKKLAVATEVMARMLRDDGCKVILSFPACIMATGTRGLIVDMVKRGWVDAIITTCGTLDHDLARVWQPYYHGAFTMDDKELHEVGVNRLGNVLVPNESYGEVLESRMKPLLAKLWEGRGDRDSWSTAELTRYFGLHLEGEEKAEESLLYWAAKQDVPIYVPGPTDGAWGSQIWQFYQTHRAFRFDLLADEQALMDFVFDASSLGALMIGGGISKHHAIWWAQFRDGLDYAVYLTTAQEYDGSLSGARVREAVSWGKVKEDARYVTVEGDATVTLPMILAALPAVIETPIDSDAAAEVMQDG
ncbi:MAG: deoxyhypusine synthase [Euryarchaeota archaeon]|nr:deoxyhypusine synthase [Euryarchaeota archaeon]